MARLKDKIAFEGESLSEDFRAPAGTTALVVNLADDTSARSIKATSVVDIWHFAASPSDLKGLSGKVRWNAMVHVGSEDMVIDYGSIYIRPLVSKYREVLAAIDEALKSWDSSPNHTVSVGEITITAKTRSDLVSARAYWQGRADADESGSGVGGGPLRLKVCF